MQSTRARLCEYKYDALDRLINQHQPNAPTHQRFYCKSRLATEIHGTLWHSIIEHDDLLLAEQKREGSTTDTTLLATDLQRSALNTLKQGVAPHPVAYSPYGHRPALGGLLSLLGFNGERPDLTTGHYLLGNGYRAFNPVLMRFNSPDSLSPFGKGGFNAYVYCLSDPINKGDTDGHAPFNFITKPLSKIFQKLKYPLKGKYTDMGKVYSQTPPPSTENMGKLFYGLQPMPAIQDQILRMLNGTDLSAFSLASKNSNRLVQNAKLSPNIELGSAAELSTYSQEVTDKLAKKVDSIISGESKGILPGDFANTALGKKLT